MSKHTATLNFQQMYTDSVKDRARLEAQNREQLAALEAARPDLLAYSNSYGGDYLRSLRLVDAAIAAAKGEEK